MALSKKQVIAGGVAVGAAAVSHAANVHAATVFGTTPTVIAALVSLFLIAAAWLWAQLQRG